MEEDKGIGNVVSKPERRNKAFYEEKKKKGRLILNWI
jgi:hypothetical protein